MDQYRAAEISTMLTEWSECTAHMDAESAVSCAHQAWWLGPQEQEDLRLMYHNE